MASRRSELGPIIHEEHFRTLMLLCGLENRVSGKRANQPLNPSSEEDRTLLEELIDGLGELIVHNTFEESELLPRLCREGAEDLANLLRQEHILINPMAARLREQAYEILENGLSGSSWTRFRYASLDLISLVILHLQKEELALVQRLGVLLEPDIDYALARRYAPDHSFLKSKPDPGKTPHHRHAP